MLAVLGKIYSDTFRHNVHCYKGYMLQKREQYLSMLQLYTHQYVTPELDLYKISFFKKLFGYKDNFAIALEILN